MKQLIVNADGFGFTYGNNRAILEVLAHGFIRSVSVNVTWPAVEEVQNLMRHFPHVTVGVHLNLSVGPPVLPPAEIPSLVDSAGEFWGERFPARARKRLLDPQEMRRELAAQIDRLRQYGVTITHWDSHQGRHLYPGFFQAALAVGREARIPASRSHHYYMILPRGRRLMGLANFYRHHPRQSVSHMLAAVRTRAVARAGFRLPDRRLVLSAFGPDAVYRPDCWEVLLETMPDGVNFIECHPGYADETLRKYSSMVEFRERERELFSDPRWAGRAQELGCEPISYRALLDRYS